MANIFEGMEQEQVQSLRSIREMEPCGLEAVGGARTSKRRNALANIFEGVDMSSSSEFDWLPDLVESINERAQAMVLHDEDPQPIATSLSTPDTQEEERMDLDAQVTEVAVPNRRRRAALGDIFSDIPLKNGMRSRHFQLLYELSTGNSD